MNYLSESLFAFEASFCELLTHFIRFRPTVDPPRSLDCLDSSSGSSSQIGGSPYHGSQFMAGCPILISMSYLTYLLNQLPSLAGTVLCYFGMFMCKVFSHAAVSESLRLRWSFTYHALLTFLFRQLQLT